MPSALHARDDIRSTRPASGPDGHGGSKGSRAATVARRSELFHEAVAVVEAELASDLQLADVAARIATSPRQLQRVFAEIGGTTFRRHRARLRLERAREHLLDGLSVSETAALVGYRHPAHFSAAFRERYGVAPSAYRDGAQAADGDGGAAPAGGR
jgi:AraC family transcriptional regulator of adaptative response / methylphosphotriester-DNA alkyltransferase methyltransferase